MNWVLFKTKKPKNGQLVYTYNLDKDIFNIGYYDNKYKCTIDYDDFMIDATHWSLPQTPKEGNMEFNIIVKGVRYHLRAYKSLRNEWDLIVNGKLVCDGKPYDTCLWCFLDLIKEVGINEI